MAELIWDGKYDEHGHKRAPVRIELPFQTVETVNESVQERQRTLELSSSGNDPEWRNRLIWGDKKYVLPSLLPEFAGKVDLIYIDPPFDTGADFSYTATLPDHDDSDDEQVFFTKEPSLVEQKAYRDTWGRGFDSYLSWFHETALLLRELMTESGTIYVHIGQNVSHYVKGVLDEVFGTERYVNQIVWRRQTAHSDIGQGSAHLGRLHDVILLYTKTESYAWHMQYTAYESEYAEAFYKHVDPENGRRYQLSDLSAPGKSLKGNPYYEFLGVTRYWRFSEKRMKEMYKEGRIVQTRPGTVPRQKRYIDEMPGVQLQDLWLDVKPIQSQAAERAGYDTQKPEALLDRILNLSSSEGNLVLDCFCGSGTTAAVAEKLNRRWITCDLGRFAIHTTRKRLLGIPGVKPFVVQNLGEYERQQWQVAEFAPSPVIASPTPVILSGVSGAQGAPLTQSKDPVSAGTHQRPDREFSRDRGGNASMGPSSPPAATGSFDSAVGSPSRTNRSAQDDRLTQQQQREAAYRKFILELYHATPVSGHVWLHGVKAGRMVHVGAVDAPVTRADVNAIAAEVWKAAGKGANSPEKPAVDVLGWEFALELNETAKEIAAQARVDAAFKKIPREVLEKKAVEQGDVHFFELGALKVESKVKKRELTLTLSNFIIPLDDVPAEVRSAIKHWSQMVDYWAVDWDYKDDTFHNQWQSYRTRKNPKLELSVKHECAESREYTVVVKVIDILGNDTTKTLTVEIK